MTRADAKQKALEMWGGAGAVTRLGIVLALLGSFWMLASGFKNAMEGWLVSRRDFQVYVHERDTYFAQRDAVLAVWLVADSAQKADIVRQLNELKLLVKRP